MVHSFDLLKNVNKANCFEWCWTNCRKECWNTACFRIFASVKEIML